MISEDAIVELLGMQPAHQLFKLRFTDQSEAELMDCWLRTDEAGTRECLGTVVRPGTGCRAVAGDAICFRLNEVANVSVSDRGFEYWR